MNSERLKLEINNGLVLKVLKRLVVGVTIWEWILIFGSTPGPVPLFDLQFVLQSGYFVPWRHNCIYKYNYDYKGKYRNYMTSDFKEQQSKVTEMV